MPVKFDDGRLSFETGLDNSGLKKDAKKAEQILSDLRKMQERNEREFIAKMQGINDSIQKSSQESRKQIKGLGTIAGTLGGALAGAFSVQLLIQFEKQLARIVGEFEKMEAVLTNTLGSKSDAQAAMAQIVQFASQTPFQVDQLTDSFVKLANQGFKPTVDELRNLGDLASSTGKDFDQLAEAIIDAQVGEFERLKEFGIRASKEGDNVTFTFKGVQEQVEFTESSIRKYILSLGDAEGVSGAMAAISDTVAGKISNLDDNITVLAKTIGDRQSGVFKTSLDWLNEFISLATLAVSSTSEIRNQMRLVTGAAGFQQTNKEVDELISKLSKRMGMEEAINKAVDLTIKSYRDLSDNIDGDITFGRLNKQIHELEKYRKQLLSGYSNGGIETLNTLNKELANLQKQRSEIDITNTDALNKNLQQQLKIKKKIEAVDIKAIKNQKSITKQISYFSDRQFLDQAEKLKGSLLDQTETFNKFQENLGKAGLSTMENTGAKALDLQKEFYQSTAILTVRAAKVLLQKAENELDSSTITKERKEELKQFIRDLNKFQLDDIFKLGNALGNLGQSLIQLGESSRSAGLANIGGLLSGLASGVNDVLVAFDKEARDSDKIFAGVNGLIKVIDTLSSAAAQRKKAEEDYYRSVIGFQQDYNLSLQEQIRLQSILGESAFITDYEGRIKDGLAASENAISNYQKAIEALTGGTVKSGQRNAIDWGNVGQSAAGGAAAGAAIGSIVPVIGTAIGTIFGGIAGAIGGLFGGKKKVDNYVPLLQEYPELVQETSEGVYEINRGLAESLIQNDLLSDSTKELVQDVLDWGDALDEAREQIKGVISDLAGSLGNDLRDDLVESFKAGEDAAKKMGKTVSEVLENILSQLLFNKIFADNFEQLEKDMAASMDIGGDQSWTDDLARFYKGFAAEQKDFNKLLEENRKQSKAYGFDVFGASPTAKQGLTRQVQSLTEDTGKELSGLFRGFYDLQKKNNNTLYTHMKHGVDQLMELQRIEYNTKMNIVKWDQAIPIFRQIQENTKASKGNRDLGIND
ncbi:hypothetical protein KZP23_07555 [Echinicola marina]|uniref:hypothetical protein n=1 Tax=Echinicola marina TaxID=2859768 RepID=UPI001CF62BDB|nr:hypothetical protein [Echinicola marina]UCS94856.1 hypothetical protein KZP23_07555 [Echinicola marina]